ncbi:ATP-binding cassette domain-containing protein [Saccharibacillus sp. CPCC 101409]|uniref:ABC transporter ATP-binding protein n=1 Tax=Saccharibacillus sp. CPCC 101409 TaxID=3058041 RepID=UPI00267372A5|nr:ATP-binding cassette domain-containing protein [Saccharibacillus sp. CPCC 101409]MDO3412620.1 ATP-binding cassette domain-containing protein [Saccharibacillus sp. CPCC 101409]
MAERLVLRDVIKRYGDKTAVDRISLDVHEGEIYGLLGANGAGKTTTMRMVLGLIYPDDGSITYGGHAYGGDVQRDVGYLPEERGLYPKVKVSEQIVYLAKLRGMNGAEADKSLRYWLNKFDADEYYDKRIEELSKGNQQKMGFIAAVVHRPNILILDEAFSGLDPVNVELLKLAVKELREEGASILFSTHRMEHVEELCRSITILDRSKTVLQGDIREIKQRFPREQILLKTLSPVSGLESLPGVTGVEGDPEGYTIRIADESAALPVLTEAMRQSEVRHFEVKEPTLNQIFIRSVGERHE